MKPVYFKDNTYIDFEEEVNAKDPKFKTRDHVRISKYKNVFTKGYMPNWSKEVFIISTITNTVHGHILSMISMVKKSLEHFMKKNQKEFRIEKVL